MFQTFDFGRGEGCKSGFVVAVSAETAPGVGALRLVTPVCLFLSQSTCSWV